MNLQSLHVVFTPHGTVGREEKSIMRSVPDPSSLVKGVVSRASPSYEKVEGLACETMKGAGTQTSRPMA